MNKILVFLEAQNEGLKRTSYEVITAAKDLAAKAGASFSGVIFGGTDSQAAAAGKFGLSDMISVKSDVLNTYSSTAAAKVIAEVVKAEGADIVLMSGNAAGLELGPRVAVKLEAGYLSDIIALEDEGGLVAKKPIYAGKATVKCKIETANQVYSLRPNVFTAVETGDGPAAMREDTVELSDADKTAYVVNVAKNEGKLDVLEADVIVSGGRGVKGPENYNLIEDLAAVLGGAVGASRAVVDAGWRPHSEQVGQTGKTVSPSLYIACGISGAVQHLAGMSSSKIIFAINKDKDAPIFKVADYGIVGDLLDVVPKLTNRIKDMK